MICKSGPERHWQAVTRDQHTSRRCWKSPLWNDFATSSTLEILTLSFQKHISVLKEQMEQLYSDAQSLWATRCTPKRKSASSWKWSSISSCHNSVQRRPHNNKDISAHQAALQYRYRNVNLQSSSTNKHHLAHASMTLSRASFAISFSCINLV